MSKVLILDGNFLAWRAAHSTGSLSHKGEGTGVIYGFLRDMLKLQEQFATTRIAFAFDSRSSKREEVFPDYKKKRKEQKFDREQRRLLKRVRTQIRLLRDEIIPYLCYENVFYAKGFEGDDIIASVVANLDRDTGVVLVSGDRDLYQLISRKVIVWNPNAKESKAVTEERFKKELGITPDLWVKVKAIAGCSTDGVPGLKGCGEKTAIKFLTKERIANKELYFAIKRWITSNEYLRNLDLIRIPYPGTPDFRMSYDSLDPTRFHKLIKKYGMGSLESMVRKT